MTMKRLRFLYSFCRRLVAILDGTAGPLLIGLAVALNIVVMHPAAASTVLAGGTHTFIFGHGAAQRRGGKIFADTGCSHCHGTNGIGGGRGPDLRDVGDKKSKEQIRFQVEHGGKSMPAYGNILDANQVNDLIVYLRTHRDRSYHPGVQAAASTPVN